MAYMTLKPLIGLPHFLFLDNDKIPRYGALFVCNHGGITVIKKWQPVVIVVDVPKITFQEYKTHNTTKYTLFFATPSKIVSKPFIETTCIHFCATVCDLGTTGPLVRIFHT